jgi:hypothetical protein
VLPVAYLLASGFSYVGVRTFHIAATGKLYRNSASAPSGYCLAMVMMSNASCASKSKKLSALSSALVVMSSFQVKAGAVRIAL